MSRLGWVRCLFRMILPVLILSLLAVSVGGAAADDQPVFVIPVRGVIDGGTASFLKRSFREAAAEGAAAVILELDTPGGYVATAEEIRWLIDDFVSPVYVFVRPRAVSAGAYLALVADGIYMVPGATMGAAELRLLWGEPVDEKELSHWEGEMRAVAGRRGRDPEIAAAMVRRDLGVEGLAKKGELLTLTAIEAEEIGYCEGIVNSRNELMQAVGLDGHPLVEPAPSFWDRLVAWTTHPVFATLFLIVAIGALVVEVLTPGLGAAGVISLAAFALYFGGHVAAGSAEYWVVILFGFGLIMLLVEAFIPGFGIFGITGIAATLASIVLAAATLHQGLIMLSISLVLSAVMSYLLFRFLSRRGALRHIILADEARSELGYVAPADYRHLQGARGTALTPLRPAGAAEFNGERADVISEGLFIPAGTPVEVIAIEGVRVIVRSILHPDSRRSGRENAGRA